MADTQWQQGEETDKKKKDAGPKTDPAVAATQIRNLDNAVKRLHQQRDSTKKQMAEDEKELKWVMHEIQVWQAKRERTLQQTRNHQDQMDIIKRTTKECKNKLDNELLAGSRALTAATKKSIRNLEKKQYVPKHKV